MPDRSVLAAAGTLFVCALAGLYLGVSRAGPAGADDTGEGEIVPAVTPVSSAKAIAAPVQTMDEAEVRRLAHEEAMSVLAARAPVKHAPSPASDDDTDDSSAPPAPEPLAPVVPQHLSTPASTQQPSPPQP